MCNVEFSIKNNEIGVWVANVRLNLNVNTNKCLTVYDYIVVYDCIRGTCLQFRTTAQSFTLSSFVPNKAHLFSAEQAPSSSLVRLTSISYLVCCILSPFLYCNIIHTNKNS